MRNGTERQWNTHCSENIKQNGTERQSENRTGSEEAHCVHGGFQMPAADAAAAAASAGSNCPATACERPAPFETADGRPGDRKEREHSSPYCRPGTANASSRLEGGVLSCSTTLPSFAKTARKGPSKALQRPFKADFFFQSSAFPLQQHCRERSLRTSDGSDPEPPRAHFGIATEAGCAAMPRPTPPGLSRWCCVGATTEEPPQRRYRHGGRRVVPCQCPRSGPMIMVMSMSRAGAVGEWGWGGEGGGKRRTPVSAAIESFCGCVIGAGNAGASAST